jgi:hypothetical protein
MRDLDASFFIALGVLTALLVILAVLGWVALQRRTRERLATLLKAEPRSWYRGRCLFGVPTLRESARVMLVFTEEALWIVPSGRADLAEAGKFAIPYASLLDLGLEYQAVRRDNRMEREAVGINIAYAARGQRYDAQFRIRRAVSILNLLNSHRYNAAAGGAALAAPITPPDARSIAAPPGVASQAGDVPLTSAPGSPGGLPGSSEQQAVCSACGRIGDIRSAFCSACGSPMARRATRCPACDHPVGINDAFCSACGTSLTAAAPLPIEPLKKPAAPGPATAPPTAAAEHVEESPFQSVGQR